MRSERLDIDDLEPDGTRLRDGLLDRDELTIGEDVSLQEPARRRPTIRHQAIATRPGAGDPMVEEEAAGPQRVVRGAEVGREVAATDMLEHADRGDTVECAEWPQIAIVAHL